MLKHLQHKCRAAEAGSLGNPIGSFVREDLG